MFALTDLAGITLPPAYPPTQQIRLDSRRRESSLDPRVLSSAVPGFGRDGSSPLRPWPDQQRLVSLSSGVVILYDACSVQWRLMK
jgi:hypothetical protein